MRELPAAVRKLELVRKNLKVLAAATARCGTAHTADRRPSAWTINWALSFLLLLRLQKARRRVGWKSHVRTVYFQQHPETLLHPIHQDSVVWLGNLFSHVHDVLPSHCHCFPDSKQSLSTRGFLYLAITKHFRYFSKKTVNFAVPCVLRSVGSIFPVGPNLHPQSKHISFGKIASRDEWMFHAEQLMLNWHGSWLSRALLPTPKPAGNGSKIPPTSGSCGTSMELSRHTPQVAGSPQTEPRASKKLQKSRSVDNAVNLLYNSKGWNLLCAAYAQVRTIQPLYSIFSSAVQVTCEKILFLGRVTSYDVLWIEAMCTKRIRSWTSAGSTARSPGWAAANRNLNDKPAELCTKDMRSCRPSRRLLSNFTIHVNQWRHWPSIQKGKVRQFSHPSGLCKTRTNWMPKQRWSDKERSANECDKERSRKRVR